VKSKLLRRRRWVWGSLACTGWACFAWSFQACGGSGDTDDAASSGGSGSGGEGGPDSGGSASGASAAGGDDAGSGSTGSGGSAFGTAGYDCSPPSGTVPVLQATAIVTSGLGSPTFLAHEPDGEADRLFVLDRQGVIRIIEGGELSPEPFLDISSKVIVDGEYGLLGLAFAPDYQDSGRFYVHYSDNTESGDAGDSIIEEYQVSSDRNVADLASARLVLKVEQSQDMSNHKGGSIAFGLDGFLYIGLGDGGGGGDPDGNGQDVGVLLGKLLRIDPRETGSDPYSVPADNLIETLPAAAPEIWDFGLRNPFRFTFDGCTGDLYIGDVGQGEREELDVELAGAGRKNYGWNVTEGLRCYEPSSGCTEAGITPPVHDYDHTVGKSITGGAVYRGSSLPGIRGAYFFADYTENKLWMTVYDRAAGTVSTPVSLTQDLNNLTQVVSITNGADGELYFVSLQGGVYRLDAAE
jgi:glucose/arabinose dehydrogenase